MSKPTTKGVFTEVTDINVLKTKVNELSKDPHFREGQMAVVKSGYGTDFWCYKDAEGEPKETEFIGVQIETNGQTETISIAMFKDGAKMDMAHNTVEIRPNGFQTDMDVINGWQPQIGETLEYKVVRYQNKYNKPTMLGKWVIKRLQSTT